MVKKFWNDDCGAIVSTEIVLVITILGIGMIVGLSTLRNAVVAELADVAAAVNNVDQSYSYSAVSGHASNTSGSVNNDVADFCDGPTSGSDSQCVAVTGQNGRDTGKPN
jgi:Flp pilus assembly pilin Flp